MAQAFTGSVDFDDVEPQQLNHFVDQKIDQPSIRIALGGSSFSVVVCKMFSFCDFDEVKAGNSLVYFFLEPLTFIMFYFHKFFWGFLWSSQFLIQ